jgi:hypothetical protein
MARSLSVKVPTAAVIAQIEAKIAEIDAQIASFPADYEKYEVETKAYKIEVAKFIGDYLAGNIEKIGYDYGSDIRLSIGNGSLSLNIDTDKIIGFPVKPIEPKRPNQSEWYGNRHINRKEVLEQNLNILRMTTQEEINASSYSSVMDLL